MKYLIAVSLSVLLLTAGNLSAKEKAALKPVIPAAGIKITKITGTVKLMKDGLVVMTLKPGDPLPALIDSNVTFKVANGSIELEAGGEKITGGSGSRFTVNAEKGGEVKISVAAGTPVEIKGTAGNNVVLAQNSAVTMTNTGAKMELSVQKGSALVTNVSGGTPQNVRAGEAVSIPASTPAPVAPVVPAPAAPAVPEEPVVSAPEEAAVVVPPPSISETKEVAESCEVSGSTPGCN